LRHSHPVHQSGGRSRAADVLQAATNAAFRGAVVPLPHERRLSLLLAIRRLEKKESIVARGENKCALRMDYFVPRHRLSSSANSRRFDVEWPPQATRPQQFRILGSQRLSYLLRQPDFGFPVDLCTADHGGPVKNKAHGSCYPDARQDGERRGDTVSRQCLLQFTTRAAVRRAAVRVS